MKILFAGNKERGLSCLKALCATRQTIIGVIAHPPADQAAPPNVIAQATREMGFLLFQPQNVNDPKIIADLRELSPDLIVLAGYGQIVKQDFIDLALYGCINLHGGKLPQYRGSSPMNWALINGEKEFMLSIIQVESGIDSGDVLNERTFPISINDTIVDLHRIANHTFPEMLLDVVSQIEKGALQPRKQDETFAAYYPLRFPEDGLILWDIYTAEQIHNRIRALTEPYPGAFSFYQGKRFKLLASRLTDYPFYGEPGRIYRKNQNGLLVCAMDRCLWITRAAIEKSGEDAHNIVHRYEKFATVRDAVTPGFES